MPNPPHRGRAGRRRPHRSLYDFGAIGKPSADARPNAPLVLMTAHRAKGLEFDHVLILDGGGWQGSGDDERRLFYVAMTRRARRSRCARSSAGGIPSPVSWTAWCCARGPKRTRRSRRRPSDLGRRPGDDRALLAGPLRPAAPLHRARRSRRRQPAHPATAER